MKKVTGILRFEEGGCDKKQWRVGRMGASRKFRVCMD